MQAHLDWCPKSPGAWELWYTEGQELLSEAQTGLQSWECTGQILGSWRQPNRVGCPKTENSKRLLNAVQ